MRAQGDLVIATDCLSNGLVLIEEDRHFAAIAAHLPLDLYGSSRRGPD
jgi:predicted nucleic acid-binding protein